MLPYIKLVIPTYSLMAFIGFFASMCFLYFRLERYRIEFTYFLKLFGLALLSCFVGSKALFVLTRLPELFSGFSAGELIRTIIQSGFVFYGGLFGVIFALLYVTAKDAELRKRVFDLAVPAFALFHAFGRIGCLLGGCCYGRALDPHVILFGVIELGRIPVPLIESLFEAIMFGCLLFTEKKYPQRDVLKIYLVGYALFRFFDEFLRGDAGRGIFFGLSTSQWISLAIIVYYITNPFFKKTRLVNAACN